VAAIVTLRGEIATLFAVPRRIAPSMERESGVEMEMNERDRARARSLQTSRGRRQEFGEFGEFANCGRCFAAVRRAQARQRAPAGGTAELGSRLSAAHVVVLVLGPRPRFCVALEGRGRGGLRCPNIRDALGGNSALALLMRSLIFLHEAD
jgi:hypothetical protein